MKRMILAFLTLFTIMSCNISEDQETIDSTNVETTLYKSTSLRATFKEIVRQNKGTNKNKEKELCFNFEYPIELGYNDNSTQQVADFKVLLNLLLDETTELHVTSIGFPFNVLMNDNTVQTIDDEGEFETLIDACGYDLVTVAEVYAVFDTCFTVNYPLTLVVGGETEIFNSEEGLESYFAGFSNYFKDVKFSYPVSINYLSDGSTDAIENDFELVHLITETCEID
ncbi:MAG: hypothetical protein WBG71_09495 [Leeuwenhoekiella sp.]